MIMISKLLVKLIVPVLLAATSVAGQAADIKDRSIKMPIVNNIDHPQGVGAKKFAELVEQ
jgi:TRAP-type C4-dicarboxylate transport system substrate-binding protein